jgi:hypothetical protein
MTRLKENWLLVMMTVAKDGRLCDAYCWKFKKESGKSRRAVREGNVDP